MHSLDNCPQCHSPLRQAIKNYKRYTVDIPPVEPEVTEHTVYGYWCSHCKKTVYPKISDAMPNSTLGLSMLIMTAWLHYWVGMSVRNVVKLLATFWAFEVSPGGLTQAWKNLASHFVAALRGYRKKVLHAAVLNADETGWRISGITHWLWCFVTDKWCYFVIDKSRGSPVIKRTFRTQDKGVLTNFLSCSWGGKYFISNPQCF